MKKVLIIIGSVLLGFVTLGCVIFAIVSLTSHKLRCTSSRGDITIMYNDEQITGYNAKNISYDMDGANDYVKEVGGIENYLIEFNDWFVENTSGTCEKF